MTRVDASEVFPGLAVGGRALPGPAIAEAGWSVLVLCSSHQPVDFPGLRRRLPCPFKDAHGILGDAATVRQIRKAVDKVVWFHGRGLRVLVTCVEGRNRSALVAALALRRIAGVAGPEAVRMVRAARNPVARAARIAFGYPEELVAGRNYVLTNRDFEAWAEGRLDPGHGNRPPDA